MSNPTQTSDSKIKKRRGLRVLLMIAGTISLALGTVGLFLPILPTTPFLLVAAACYMRSSERMYNWLLKNRWFGEYLRNYQEGRGIPLKTKIFAISILWITILFSTFFFLSEILAMQIVLILIATVVSVHLIRLPTFKK
ncbi:MAG: YbaN family protein [Candidatus Bathyarchaeia archaeon]|jgi:uncharacterized membrane protein YbaN (DUF454 family)